MLHVRPWCAFAVLLHLWAEQATRATGRLRTSLRTIGRVGTEIRQETVRAVDGVWDFRGHGLVERDRTRVVLDRVVISLALHLLSLHLFALTLLTLPMGHFLLALALEDLALPGVPLTLAVQSLGRRMLHGLADAWKRVSGGVGGACGMLSVGWRLVRSPVALAKFCQSGEGVSARLTGRVVGTCSSACRLAFLFNRIHLRSWKYVSSMGALGRNANRRVEGGRAQRAARPGLGSEDFDCEKNLR